MNLLASLRYLVALHEHRHFGRAAAACHITQPALSNALRALESEFGVTIAQRGRSFVGFTPEGERVLASARTMLRERELLAQDLSSQSGAPHGTLVIGAVPSAMPVAARFAALLQRRHPGIVPTLRSLSSTDIELGLDELTVDVALGYTDRAGMGAHPPPRRGERRVLAQYTERYYLVSRAPRARAAGLKIVEPMPWREAARRPLCLLTPEMHNRSIVDAAFARRHTGAAGDANQFDRDARPRGGGGRCVQRHARRGAVGGAQLPRAAGASAGAPRDRDAGGLHDPGAGAQFARAGRRTGVCAAGQLAEACAAAQRQPCRFGSLIHEMNQTML